MIMQLKQVRKKDAEFQGMDPGKVLKMALLIVPSYQWGYEEENLKPFSEQKLKDVHQKLLTSLPDTQPDWHCIWQPHEQLRVFQYPEDKSWESYPYLGIFAKVMPV